MQIKGEIGRERIGWVDFNLRRKTRYPSLPSLSLPTPFYFIIRIHSYVCGQENKCCWVQVSLQTLQFWGFGFLGSAIEVLSVLRDFNFGLGLGNCHLFLQNTCMTA